MCAYVDMPNGWKRSGPMVVHPVHEERERERIWKRERGMGGEKKHHRMQMTHVPEGGVRQRARRRVSILKGP